MKILRAFKTELDPNNKQINAFMQHCGAARFAYNWGLERKKTAMDTGNKIPSNNELKKELRALKKTDLGWLGEVSTWTSAEALRDLDRAFDAFFSRCKKKKAGTLSRKNGFPKFRSRKRSKMAFTFYDYRVFADAIQIPKIGKVRLKQADYLPIGGRYAEREDVKYLRATVSEKAGRWYISIQVEMEIPDPVKDESKPVVGVDFGIESLATLSDGTTIESPRPYKKNLRKLKKLQRAVSRKKKGSQNRRKAIRKLAGLHAKVANIRSNTLHQISARLTRENQTIVIEDLNVSGMMKNRHLAQAIGDMGFGELRRQLEYKGQWHSCEVIFANRWYPSSKTCSNCESIKADLTLKDRVYRCERCGFTCDRDLNAALNLKKLAGRMPDNSNACGWESTGLERIPSETNPCEAGTMQQLVLALTV